MRCAPCCCHVVADVVSVIRDCSLSGRQGRGLPGSRPRSWRRSNGPSATGAKAAPGKMVLPVKLLYVVSARVFNTKHSSSVGAAQVLFAPQQATTKPTRKQCANGASANDHRSLHRVSTVLSTTADRARPTDERVGRPLQFCHTSSGKAHATIGRIGRSNAPRDGAKTRGRGTADIGIEANYSAM